MELKCNTYKTQITVESQKSEPYIEDLEEKKIIAHHSKILSLDIPGTLGVVTLQFFF